MKNDFRKKARTWALIALMCLGLHYGMIVLAHLIIHGGLDAASLGSMMIERLTQPGDATRYLDIAMNGYTAAGENAINLVFYPLYPLFIRLLGAVLGDYGLSGVLISQISYAAASILLYEMLLLDGDRRRAWDGVLLLALYPFSMFTMGIFSESLFLALVTGCLYALRRRNMAWVGITGFLAALTRAQGVLLLFPAVYEIVTLRFGEAKRKPRPADAALLLIPAGFGVYLLINYALHGNCFQFLTYEAGKPWYQSTRWVGSNIAMQYGMAKDNPGLEWIIYWVQIALYFIALITLLAGIRKRQRISEILFGAVYLGFTYLSGWMISGGRYLLCCIPLYVIWSGMKPGLGRTSMISGCAMLFFAYSLFYLIGYAIM